MCLFLRISISDSVLGGDKHTEGQAKTVSLMFVLKKDKSIKETANIDYGKSAYRKTEKDKWRTV